MKVLNANIEEIHVRVRPIKTSYCLVLQSKALIPDNMLYSVLFILLNILFCVIRPIINTLFRPPIFVFVSILEIILCRL
ncbi:hypothetical protein DWW08_18715 [Bacteroides fragilis]|uniref:Transmembrane protein n=1 Tax=Bacteroides fragilis TaxID=817 RepID=A0A412XWP8_BACFG|nr:hypothetical protein DWW08_18715 [Bacteroides fragilis]